VRPGSEAKQGKAATARLATRFFFWFTVTRSSEDMANDHGNYDGGLGVPWVLHLAMPRYWCVGDSAIGISIVLGMDACSLPVHTALALAHLTGEENKEPWPNVLPLVC